MEDDYHPDLFPASGGAPSRATTICLIFMYRVFDENGSLGYLYTVGQIDIVH